MSRARKGAAVRKKKKRILRRAKGFVQGRGRLWRTAAEAVIRAGVYATRDRKQRKRHFRALWIIRLNAAARENGMRYSELVEGMRKAGVKIDRRQLSAIAIDDPAAFKAVLEIAREARAKSLKPSAN
ncbi:MAG: 50S ribosomal protein L20 [Planctomycetota bacterium]